MKIAITSIKAAKNWFNLAPSYNSSNVLLFVKTCHS